MRWPNSARSRRRRGLTLVEILVCFGIISLLTALALPAVQAAREAARRAACGANLRQVGLGPQAYATTWDCFPPGGVMAPSVNGDPMRPVRHFSVHTSLLPHLEQTALHDSINFDLGGTDRPGLDPGNWTAADTSLAVFLCPSDPGRSRVGSVSYRANGGLRFGCWERDEIGFGAFGMWCHPVATFEDGLSNTLAFSEKPIGRPGRWARWSGWSAEADVPVLSDGYLSICARVGPATPFSTDAGRHWFLPGGARTLFFVIAPPNSSIPDCGRGPGIRGLYTARSYHPDGVQAVMGDGSVRWVAGSINPATWKALGSRAGGEIVP